MRVEANQLIQDLIEKTLNNKQIAQELKAQSSEILNHKVNQNQWSALECIEHLNRYGDFYIPEIKRSLNAATEQAAKDFKSGLIGNYFAKSLAPGQKPMKTLKNMNPAVPEFSQLRANGLDEFIAQQMAIIALLEQARAYNLTKVKTAISISKLLKLRLGDTFRVVIYHNQRHMAQAQRAVDQALRSE